MVLRFTLENYPIYNDLFCLGFIQNALREGFRMDGRNVDDFRDVFINLTRDEVSSSADIIIGNSRVICNVKGDIVPPHSNSPNEGLMHINVALSAATIELNGISEMELCRLIEYCVQENNVIDMESLCIIDGTKVWRITCDVCIVDSSGGNLRDISVIAVITALRAFRRPEVLVIEANGNYLNNNQVYLYCADEKDPLQLALHHIPIPLTIGLITKTTAAKDVTNNLVFIGDPTAQEELLLEGIFFITIDANG